METIATETQDERICRTAHNLAVLAKEQKVRIRESKELCLAAIEILLANPDFFCDDFNKQLEEEKETHLDLPEDETIEDSEQQNGYIVHLEHVKAEIWKHLDGCVPKLQRDVLEIALVELPEKEREYDEEAIASEACDELTNFIYHGLPATEQTKVYKRLLEQMKTEKAAAA